MVPPLTPTLANGSLQNKADNCFSRLGFLSSLMAQGPGEARHDIAAAPGPLRCFENIIIIISPVTMTGRRHSGKYRM
jgi:hypothetical protein